VCCRCKAEYSIVLQLKAKRLTLALSSYMSGKHVDSPLSFPPVHSFHIMLTQLQAPSGVHWSGAEHRIHLSGAGFSRHPKVKRARVLDHRGQAALPGLAAALKNDDVVMDVSTPSLSP
jgi:hypothetical protein